jgi:hypothetical protein
MDNFKVPDNNKTENKPVMARNPHSGARVFGLPISRELESFIDDAVPNNDQKRIFNMFFAGRFGASVQMISEEEEEDF